jgi:hypothetical protein
VFNEVKDDDGHPVAEAYTELEQELMQPKVVTVDDIVLEMKILIDRMIESIETLQKLNKEL